MLERHTGIKTTLATCDEEEFKNVKTGGDWRPKYDYMMFKKSVDIEYSAVRE